MYSGNKGGPMKYFTKLKLYKASNVVFDPQRIEATSYSWWYFVKVINGRVVFNDYRYSPTTSQHQSKVRSLLDHLGIKIDLEIRAPKGLQDPHSAIEFCQYEINQLEKLISNPRSRKGSNIARTERIEELKQEIKTLTRLVGPDRSAYLDSVWRENVRRVA